MFSVYFLTPEKVLRLRLFFLFCFFNYTVAVALLQRIYLHLHITELLASPEKGASEVTSNPYLAKLHYLVGQRVQVRDQGVFSREERDFYWPWH